MSKVLIAVPTYENIYPDTFKSIYEMDRGEHEFDFNFFRGYDVANARNQIGQATIDGGYDYVFMLDNDEIAPKDAVLNLIEIEEAETDKGMAVGYTLTRPTGAVNQNGRTSVFKFGGRDYTVEKAYLAKEFIDLRDKGTYKIQVRGSGLGSALIHRSVFERLKYPWFKWVTYDNKTQLSEDLFFCEKFKHLGVPIFVDTRVACGHVMRYIKWPNE